MSRRLLVPVICVVLAAGGASAVPLAAAAEPPPEIPAEVWEAPDQVNRTPVGGTPSGTWAYADASNAKARSAAADDAVAAPGLGVQEHYAFEEFVITDLQTAAVNLGNGNLVVRAEDVTINGPGLGLSLDRFYNGLSSRVGGYGPKWSISAAHDIGLEVGPSSIVFRGPSGFRARFSQGDGGEWVEPAGLNADLVHASGGEWELTYHRTDEKLVFTAGGYLLRHEDRNGNALTYAYNTDNTAASVTDAAGRVTTFAYSGGRVSEISDPAGRTTRYTYDTVGRLTGTDRSVSGSPARLRTSYEYDSLGRLSAAVTDSRAFEFDYDDENRVTAVHQGEPDEEPAWTTEFAYDQGATEVTDPKGNVTTYAIDDDGRVSSTSDPLGRTRSQTWTPNAAIATTTDAMSGTGGEGNVTTYEYDSSNNPSGISMPTGAAAQATYATGDECGSTTAGHPYRIKCSSDPAGNETAYEYDTAGNLASETDASDNGTGRELTYTHQGIDGADCGGKPGQRCTATNGEGHTTTFAYDGDGNLITVTPPPPLGATNYEYDALGRATKVTDGRGVQTTYYYDALDRLTSQIAGDSDVHHVSLYDDSGNLDTELVYRKLPDGSWHNSTAQYTHDARGNVLSKKIFLPGSGDPEATMTYDANGNLATYTDVAGTLTYAYDAANQLTSITEPGGSCGTGAPATASGCVKFEYDSNGSEIARLLPGGASIQTERDASGRPTRITTTDANGDAVVDYAYTFADPANDEDRARIQTRTDHVGVHAMPGSKITYTYDSLSRLTKAEESETDSNVWEYAYDANGNRIEANGQTYQFNAADQLVGMNGNTGPMAYDGAGNATADADGDNATYSASGQARNWRVGADTYEAEYLDATNAFRAILDLGYGTVSEFQSPLGLSVTEVESDIIGREDSRVAFTRAPDGELVGVRDANGARYIVADHQRTVNAVLFSDGTLSGSASYDPYGQERGSSGDVIPFGYAGGQHDNHTGLIKFGARYYNPAIGTFTQMDPAGQEQNPYLYAAGDPINNTDPTGLSCNSALDAAGIIGTFAGAAAGIGGAIGAVIGSPGGPPGIIAGANTGGVLGGAAGAVFGAGYAIGECWLE